MIVADSNLIAYLFIPGDWTEISEKVLYRDHDWVAPLLWRSEFRNILTLYMKREGMSVEQAKTTMDKAVFLLNNNEYAVNSDAVIELTCCTHLSAYDAEFAVLASHLHTKLVTTDAQIVKEVSNLALSPEAFVDAHSPRC